MTNRELHTNHKLRITSRA